MVRIEEGHRECPKITSLFDLAGTSRLSQGEAFKLVDRIREEQ